MATALSNLLALLALDESAYLKGLQSSQQATDTFAGNLANVGGAIAVGAITAVGTAIVGIGSAAFDAAETVDSAYDDIAVATGATGDKLAILKDDFNAVFSDVPMDAQLVSDAISILNSRLDITGPALQGVAKPLLELSRLMGGDVTQNAEDFTRVVGDWNIPVEDAGGALDSLFVAAQETGAPIDALMQDIVKYGAPMRNFGFSFEESGALLASFAAQGVNTEIVMSGLRIAQGKFISQGKDMKTGLWDTVDAIQNATSKTDALAIATEVFGAKAAGDMVDTILSGKFSLDGLVDSMLNADGAIMNAADATSDWGEKWKEFQNKMTIVLAPMGEKIREAFGTALDAVVEIFNRPDVQAAIAKFADFAVLAIGKIVEFIPIIVDGFFQFVDFLKNNEGILIGVFVALGAAVLVWAATSIAAAASTIVAMLPVIAVIALIGAAAYLLYEAWTNNWGGIQEKTASAIEWIKGALQTVGDFFAAIWNNPLVQLYLQTALTNIQLIFGAFKAAFNGDWYRFGEMLRMAWDNAWRMIGIVVDKAWDGIKTIVSNGIENVKNFFTQTDWGEVGKNIILGIANGISAAVGFIREAAQSAAQAALDAAKGFLGINSPSTLFENQVGANMALGMVRGWESVLLSNPLTPALATATVDLNASSSVSAATPSGVGSQSAQNDTMVLEEIRRALRDLPDDIARAVRTSSAKGRAIA